VIFSFGIQFFNSAGFFGVEAELNSMQKLVFGLIITDLEHWRLQLEWWEYSGIIAQPAPNKSHNAKCSWFVTSSCFRLIVNDFLVQIKCVVTFIFSYMWLWSVESKSFYCITKGYYFCLGDIDFFASVIQVAPVINDAQRCLLSEL